MKAIHNQVLYKFSIDGLFPIFQSYKNESNSQLATAPQPRSAVVSDISKLQKWKQFTTPTTRKRRKHPLFPIFQSYKNESNSQHLATIDYDWESCFRYFKVTKMKAIHNFGTNCKFFDRVVSDISKLQKWKQFTTSARALTSAGWLFPIFQSYKNESNSQLVALRPHSSSCCFRYFKVTKMKAIHNHRSIRN